MNQIDISESKRAVNTEENRDPLADWLARVQVVMVRTSHPGNIGSAARAMKTMGLTKLCLLAPDRFPHEEATWLASGATDLLASARVVHDWPSAIGDSTIVIGASARNRRIPTPQLEPKTCARLIRELSPGQRVSILFGREASGLDNEALDQCHYHLSVPANPEYGVLNVAMAVQVVAYEIRQAFLETVSKSQTNTDAVRLPFRRLFQRLHMDEMEVSLLRGLLTAVNKQTASLKIDTEN
ncbi:MAG: RNA methyltransferase [Gammaproteobacteria bacterium]